MPTHRLASNGIFGEPRGRLLVELCGSPQTAAELAERVGTSSNAVRVHLDALRDAGLVSFSVVRRGVGKPTHVYALKEAAEYVLSTAYAPALRAILTTLQPELDGGLSAWLRRAGAALAGQERPSTRQPTDIHAALELLREFGAVVSVERHGGSHIVRSACCPLGAATRTIPETCKLLEGALGATLPSHSVQERCDRGDHPRCVFVIEAGSDVRQRAPAQD
jgi:predicted ArsR family transcriptional regulator